MIVEAGRGRAIINAHSTGEVGLTVGKDGAGETLILSPKLARQIAASLHLAADLAEDRHDPKD